MISWQKGYRNNRVEAKDANDEIERLIRKNGVASPEDIVKAAKPLRSILHNIFEWDDSIAAKGYRREQARSMVTSIRIEMLEDGELSHIPVYLSVVKDDRRGYLSSSVAMRDIDTAEMVLEEAIRGLEAWQRRFDSIDALSHAAGHVVEAIRKLRK